METKELLFKDLSARLPYGVKAQYYGSEEEMLTVDTIEAIYAQPSIEIIIGQYGLEIEYIKPYLRPMSSMTEEEEQEYHSLCAMQFDELADANTTIYYFDTIESFDWLNEHHFDYRGLIPKGLALSTEEFNLYERLKKKI